MSELALNKQWIENEQMMRQRRGRKMCAVIEKKMRVLKGLGVEKEPRTEHGADKGCRGSKLKDL